VGGVAEDAWSLLQKTAAAALVWVIAKFVFDHSEPFFPPVAAVVALGLADLRGADLPAYARAFLDLLSGGSALSVRGDEAEEAWRIRHTGAAGVGRRYRADGRLPRRLGRSAAIWRGEEERAAAEQLATFRESGFGYFLEMATRPQTIGYALLDSPVALAAWLLDHDTDSYYKIASAFVDGEPAGNLTRDHILDNVTLYWLTGTGASAARSYWEDALARAQIQASGQAPPEVSLPVGFTTFPGELWRTPRSWVESSYPNVTYFNEVNKGGHFAAWEEPELFAAEMRAAYSSLR
jgi:hypothetical protein